MLSLQEVAEMANGSRIGDDVMVRSIESDSRGISTGALFVALRGENFDGHDYIDQACQNGAHGALVETTTDNAIPQVVVEDTEFALGRMAASWRSRFDIPVVAVTGSNGKTTVKEMIGQILNFQAATLVSHGNFNNAIGLPMSLLKLRQEHRFAVVEIGMNQIGEIEYLANIAKPTIAVITNAGAAHLEFLSSVDQVAVEKGKILSPVGASGVAVLNRDSVYFDDWRVAAGARKVVSFGLSSEAGVSATYTNLEFGSLIDITTPAGCFSVELQLAAEHNVVNALAAAAVAIALGVSIKDIGKGLNSMQPVSGRFQRRVHKKGGELIDDSYNANPNSVAAAIDYLAAREGDRRMVIGDMFELGDKDESFHRDIGTRARVAGIGRLYALGHLSKATAQAFGRGARHYQSQVDLVSDLERELDPTTIVLVKGSRDMKMDQVVCELCNAKASNQQEPPC